MDFITWKVYVNSQIQEVEMPSEYGYTEVREDLTKNCGFPEDIIIKKAENQ